MLLVIQGKEVPEFVTQQHDDSATEPGVTC